MKNEPPSRSVLRLVSGRFVLFVLIVAVVGYCALRPGAPSRSRTVVLIAIDDLRADHLRPYGYDADPAPHLTALANEGTVLADYVTASTAVTPAMASLLTGQDVDGHGLRSVHDLGRHRLPRFCDTLAEDFASRGWTTLAAVSLRQLEGRLSGLDQGFSTYLDDALPRDGDPLAAVQVVARLVEALEVPLDAERNVFVFLHLGDLREPAPSDSGLRLERFRERLRAAKITPEGELVDVLAGGVVPELSPVAEIERLIGRRRGSAPWRAWQEATYDAALSEVDAAVGELLAFLDEHDRLSRADVAVVGTRGRYLTEPRPDGELEGFSEGLIRTAALVWPGVEGTARIEYPCGPALVHGWLVRPVIGVEDRGSWSELQWFELAGTECVVVDSPRVNARAFVGSEWKFWQGRNSADVVLVRRADDVAVEGFPPDGLNLGAVARRAGERSGYGVFSMESSLVDRVRGGTGVFRPPSSPPRRFEDFLPGVICEPGAVRWSRDRDPPFRITVARDEYDLLTSPIPHLPADRGEAWDHEGDEPPPWDVYNLLTSPIPRLPADRGEAWEHEGDEPPPWDVDVVRTSGRRCRIDVLESAGEPGETVRLWIAAYPPTDGLESLAVVEAPGGRVLSEETLPGAAVVEGSLPFAVELERPSGARLAMVVEVGERYLDAARVRYLGRPFVDGELDLYFPPWLPQRMDWFLDPEAPPAHCLIPPGFLRTGGASVMDGRLDLTLEEARFLRRLGKNE